MSARSDSTPTHLSLHPRPAFSMLVVGCGGGPSEDNLSSYLLRSSAHAWSEGCVNVEGGTSLHERGATESAGSGIGAIARLIETRPDAFADFDLAGPTPLSKAYNVLALVQCV